VRSLYLTLFGIEMWLKQDRQLPRPPSWTVRPAALSNMGWRARPIKCRRLFQVFSTLYTECNIDTCILTCVHIACLDVSRANHCLDKIDGFRNSMDCSRLTGNVAHRGMPSSATEAQEGISGTGATCLAEVCCAPRGLCSAMDERANCRSVPFQSFQRS